MADAEPQPVTRSRASQRLGHKPPLSEDSDEATTAGFQTDDGVRGDDSERDGELSRLRRKLEQKTNEANDLKLECLDKQTTIDSLITELENARDTIKKLKTENTDFDLIKSEMNASFASELSILKEELANVRLVRDELQSSLNEQRMQLDQLRQKHEFEMEESEQRLMEATGSIQGLAKENSRLTLVLKQLESSVGIHAVSAAAEVVSSRMSSAVSTAGSAPSADGGRSDASGDSSMATMLSPFDQGTDATSESGMTSAGAVPVSAAVARDASELATLMFSGDSGMEEPAGSERRNTPVHFLSDLGVSSASPHSPDLSALTGSTGIIADALPIGERADRASASSIHERDMHWQKKMDEMRAQQQIDLKRIVKGYDLQITALTAKLQQLESESRRRDTVSGIHDSLQEISTKHETIESSLKQQVEDAHRMMEERQVSSQALFDKLNEEWTNYKAMAEGEIEMLKQRLKEFEYGQVEVVLTIDLDEASAAQPSSPEKRGMAMPSGLTPIHTKTDSDVDFGEMFGHMHDDGISSPFPGIGIDSRRSSMSSTTSSYYHGFVSGIAGVSPGGGHQTSLSPHGAHLDSFSQPRLMASQSVRTLTNTASPFPTGHMVSSPSTMVRSASPPDAWDSLLPQFGAVYSKIHDLSAQVGRSQASRRPGFGGSAGYSAEVPGEAAQSWRRRGSVSSTHSEVVGSHRGRGHSRSHTAAGFADGSFNPARQRGIGSARAGAGSGHSRHSMGPRMVPMTPGPKGKSRTKLVPSKYYVKDHYSDAGSDYGDAPSVSSRSGTSALRPPTVQRTKSEAKIVDKTEESAQSSWFGGLSFGRSIRHAFAPAAPAPTIADKDPTKGFPEISKEVMERSLVGTSASDLERLSAMDEGELRVRIVKLRNDNKSLAESLKLAQQKMMVIKEQEYTRRKQAQVKYDADRHQWKLHRQELVEQVNDKSKVLKKAQEKLRTKIEQATVLTDKYQALKKQCAALTQRVIALSAAGAKSVTSEESTPKTIVETRTVRSEEDIIKINALSKQVDAQRQNLAAMQSQIQQRDYTIDTLQKHMMGAQNRINELEKKLKASRDELHHAAPASSKDVLMQQIKVLKTQRKVLVKEIKDLRNQNEMLKGMLLSSGASGGGTGSSSRGSFASVGGLPKPTPTLESKSTGGSHGHRRKKSRRGLD